MITATIYEAKTNLSELGRHRYTPIPIDAAVALRAGRFLAEHRDPFDRVLAAQALADDIPILSADAKLDSFGIPYNLTYVYGVSVAPTCSRRGRDRISQRRLFPDCRRHQHPQRRFAFPRLCVCCSPGHASSIAWRRPP